jgi:hypothetical protein
MKALLITTLIVAGSLIASTADSQIYIRGHIGIGIPAPRVYIAPAPAPVIYEDEYGPEYAPTPVDEYPVETYFDLYPNYPAWGGHYRDAVYFNHYRPFFDGYRRDHIRDFSRFHEEHRGYADRDRDNRGYGDQGRDNRGYGDRGHDNRSYSNRGNDRHTDHGFRR